MSDTNKITIQSYNEHIQEYIDGTPQEVTSSVKQWIDAALDGLPLDARILEIGSAFGRDAAYIEEQGYSVDRTDATPAFVERLQNNGYEARLLNVITDEIGNQYDMVFADAVLLHFTRQETQEVMTKIYNSLKENGRFSFSLKIGEGDAWSEDKLHAPRYFCYWNRDEISAVLENTGFTNKKINESASSSHNSTKWLHIIAEK